MAECIETQSKAMTMLTIEQLSYLLKFAIQKMKQAVPLAVSVKGREALLFLVVALAFQTLTL